MQKIKSAVIKDRTLLSHTMYMIKRERKCSVCFKIFKARNKICKFCSIKCKSSFYRMGKERKYYRESRVCARCGIEFICRKDFKTKTCSRSCASHCKGIHKH